MRPANTRSHFLSGASLPNLLRMIWQNRTELTPANILPLLFILITPLLLFPMYLLEILLFSRRIGRTRITKDPVFIIGHFRSGTTYLHNLLCQDPQFGFPTTYQCFVPATFLAGGNMVKAIHKTTLPEKRPMDDVKLGQDFPQEEEFALNGLTPWSYYQCYFFPRRTRAYFTRFSLPGNGIDGPWKKAYMYIIRKMTLASHGKQLVLKNPVNTTRIKMLADLFPEAKFIYLHRDPDEVLKSTHKLFTRFLALYSFQEIGQEELKENIRWVFRQTIMHYEIQKQLVPAGHLTEVSYHDFLRDPLAETERIYRDLHLEGFAPARIHFEKYIASQSDYVADKYETGYLNS